MAGRFIWQTDFWLLVGCRFRHQMCLKAASFVLSWCIRCGARTRHRWPVRPRNAGCVVSHQSFAVRGRLTLADSLFERAAGTNNGFFRGNEGRRLQQHKYPGRFYNLMKVLFHQAPCQQYRYHFQGEETATLALLLRAPDSARRTTRDEFQVEGYPQKSMRLQESAWDARSRRAYNAAKSEQIGIFGSHNPWINLTDQQLWSALMYPVQMFCNKLSSQKYILRQCIYKTRFVIIGYLFLIIFAGI